MEAIGAALFSSTSCLRLDYLSLNIGDITVEDLDAIERGAGTVCHPTGTARYRSVVLLISSMTEECVSRLVRLFGTVGYIHMQVSVLHCRLSYRTLKAAANSCSMLTKLSLSTVHFEDLDELKDRTWLICATQLRDLDLRVTDGGGPNTLKALDALLCSVGTGLTRLRLATMAEHDNGYEAETLAPFNAAVATIIATRCLNVRELDVVGADVSFYDKLVHLLDENLLRIESLTALNPRGRYDVAWMPVFEALRDQSSGVSRYVKRLNVNNSMTSYKRHKPEIDALLAMLSVNTTLQSVVPISELPSEVRDQFKALPRQFVLLPSSPSRQRALISAIQNAKLPHLSAEALQSVFEYAGRTRRRYVL